MKPLHRTSIRAKLVITLLVSLLALWASYIVSRYAFQDIRQSVARLSDTKEKLVVVNKLFAEVNESEKLFRQLLNDQRRSDSFQIQSVRLLSIADSLRELCAGNTYQEALIDSLKLLCATREKLLLQYLDYRRNLRNDNTVMQQAKALDSLLSVEKVSVDSVVYATAQNRSVTFVDSVEIPEEEQSKGFLKRLFGSRKKERQHITKVVRNDVNTTIDTVVQTTKKDHSDEVQKIIGAIGKEQQLRRSRFYKKEAELGKLETDFHNQVSGLLSAVERDISQQTQLTDDQAGQSIEHSIDRILIITACFFLFAIIILMLMFTDITKSNKYRQLLETAREEAEQKSTSWQRFLSNMSHEIRTPLQSVIGYAGLLQQGSDNEHHLAAIKKASEHLLRVINEILDYNKIISGKLSLEQTDFELAEIINESVWAVHIQAEQKGLLLQKSVDPSVHKLWLKGDPYRLRQILINLLSNAVKFTAEGSVTIDVSAKPQNAGIILEVSVSDTGRGIAPEQQEKIFDWYQQSEGQGQNPTEGTGLGLSIVKALVTVQLGHIRLESKPGQGSRFTVGIPFALGTAREVNDTSLLTGNLIGAGTIWLVDDDAAIRNWCAEVMEQQGIVYRCFSDAAAVVRQLDIEQPTLILADIRMPEMSGFDLFRIVKQRYGAALPVVALSAQALPEEQEEIRTFGFAELLLKPFTAGQFLRVISRQLANAVNHKPIQTVQPPARSHDYISPDIWSLYMSETRADMERIEQTLGLQQMEELSMALHRIAGRSLQLGFKDIGRLCRDAERGIRSGNTPDANWKQALDAMWANIQTAGNRYEKLSPNGFGNN
jgi:signal transduction histidine kinase/CheY-like chemotaxis protein/HPt (histidine-containing phosphotransfer) domain-containing protein/CHASE3 domain sensor protein